MLRCGRALGSALPSRYSKCLPRGSERLRGLAGHFWPGGGDLESFAEQAHRQTCDVRKCSRDLARCIRVTLLIPAIDFRAARLADSTLVERPITARRPSDHSRQMTQILAAQSTSVEDRTVSVIRRSSRLIVRSQTAFDRSHPAKLKTRGTFAAPAL